MDKRPSVNEIYDAVIPIVKEANFLPDHMPEFIIDDKGHTFSDPSVVIRFKTCIGGMVVSAVVKYADENRIPYIICVNPDDTNYIQIVL